MRVIELVGLPGAGKSTIFETLRRRDETIETTPILRQRPYRALLARHLCATLAALARHRALRYPWSRDAIVMMAYVRALPAVLGPRRPEAGIVLFDQGPIYTLSRPGPRQARLAGWWDESVAAWRPLLDAVVWLDAPDTVLLDRIGARSKDHRLKGDPRAEALQALVRDRAVYEQVLARFAGGPQVLHFDTSRRSAEEIADEVLAVMSRS